MGARDFEGKFIGPFSVINVVRHFNVGQARHARPKYLCARTTIAGTAKMAAQLAQKSYCFIQAGRGLRWLLGSIRKCRQCLPLRVGKVHRAGHIRCLLAQGGQMMNAPRNYHVDGQTILKPGGIFKLPHLNAATTFQDAMINFYAPAPGIPLEPFMDQAYTTKMPVSSKYYG
jgi:hypothetical protein